MTPTNDTASLESLDLDLETIREAAEFIAKNSHAFHRGFRVEIRHPVALFAVLYTKLASQSLGCLKLDNVCYAKTYRHDIGPESFKLMSL